MSSESVSYTRLTCDRCGYTADIRETREESAWGNLNTQHKCGSAGLPHGYRADLCPMCYGSFQDWYKEKSP